MKDFITIFYPVLYALLTVLAGYLSKEIVKLVPKIVDLIVAKVGLTNYQKTKAIAWDIWNIVEEHFRLQKLIGDTVQAKITMFESLIKQKIPGITDAEIEQIRQAIAGEFNKDKPEIINAIENPAKTVEVKPTITYVAEDGTKLIPVLEPTTE